MATSFILALVLLHVIRQFQPVVPVTEQGMFRRMFVKYDSWQTNAKYRDIQDISNEVTCSSICLAHSGQCQSYSVSSGNCELGGDPWGRVQVTQSTPTPKAEAGSEQVYSAVCTKDQGALCYSPFVVDWLSITDWGHLMLQDAFFADPIPCDGGTPPYGRKRVFKLHLQTTIFLLRSFNYWIGPSETEGAFFILDLGCCISVNKVILRNSYHIWNNGGINERSTKDFTLQLSPNHLYARDAMQWTTVVQDILQSVLGEATDGDCTDVTIQEFPFLPTLAKFAKFTADTYYGHAAGLRYIKFE